MTIKSSQDKTAVSDYRSKEKKYKTLKDFWPYYLSEHRHPVNRTLHFAGATGALFWLGKAIIEKRPSYLLAALLNGYGFAWIGHFFVEKNRPATFTYPLESFACDWIMFVCILSGKIEQELAKMEEVMGE
jgi:hypothetical protein